MCVDIECLILVMLIQAWYVIIEMPCRYRIYDFNRINIGSLCQNRNCILI